MSRFAARLRHMHVSCDLATQGMSHQAERKLCSNLEQIGDVLAFFPHGLGAAEGGVGNHMDPLLLEPVYCSVIAPVYCSPSLRRHSPSPSLRLSIVPSLRLSDIHLYTTRPCNNADALVLQSCCGMQVCMYLHWVYSWRLGLHIPS